MNIVNNIFGGMSISGDNRTDMTAALEATGLDFEVTKRPVYLSDGTKVPDTEAIVRLDNKNILGTVGARYRPVQNQEAFGVFQSAFDAGLLEIELAGQLCGGAIVWVQAKVVGDPMVVVGEDVVEPYVLLANSHDGSIALRAGFTAVRLFCYNQMSAATNRGSLVTLRHTANVKLEALKAGIDAGRANLSKVVESARLLSSKKVKNDDELNLFTRRAFGFDEDKACRVESTVQELFENGKGAGYKPVRRSWWAAYNAVTEHLTHHRGRSTDSRVKSLWFGDSSKVVGRALDVALEMAA